ncbi:hypothetical protein [Xanthomarina sp. GH4-25]|uniref:hypothetical protein n=1 Tax=Xanthomarina sp. GH4-25 TaxID=3349335 RepID=UPI000D672F58|nr:hypothetical protein DI383_14235 [Flavobacteriaceae bacterium LYZ1037]
MKKLNLLFGLFIGLTILSCSSDDENNNESENQIKGGIQIGEVFFETPYVYINDENINDNNPSDLAIIMSNKYLLVDNIESGINYMYVDYLGVDFESGQKELLDYRITENASRVNNLIEGGVRLLEDNFGSDLNATEISFIINSITTQTIDFQFSFTREDGELISGYYSGDYTDVSE